MLDYYGSIVKCNEEIDTELISKFINQCNEDYIQQIIKELRRDDVLFRNYSVSGWNVFGRKQITLIIQIKLNHIKDKNEKKLKTYFCLDKYFLINDIKDRDIITRILLTYGKEF
tara:strand:- start:205 stop:546 length:342 start_codon:yes stop_codon:yes gene_type:complete